jgi:hypothetical protein
MMSSGSGWLGQPELGGSSAQQLLLQWTCQLRVEVPRSLAARLSGPWLARRAGPPPRQLEVRCCGPDRRRRAARRDGPALRSYPWWSAGASIRMGPAGSLSLGPARLPLPVSGPSGLRKRLEPRTRLVLEAGHCGIQVGQPEVSVPLGSSRPSVAMMVFAVYLPSIERLLGATPPEHWTVARTLRARAGPKARLAVVQPLLARLRGTQRLRVWPDRCPPTPAGVMLSARHGMVPGGAVEAAHRLQSALVGERGPSTLRAHVAGYVVSEELGWGGG